MVKPTYIYEGLFNAGATKFDFTQGRLITGKENTMTRAQIANEIMTHVIHTSFISQLDSLYASQTTAELSSFLSLVRTPFEFQSYWVKQMLSIDTKVAVTVIDKNNFSQMDSDGKR
jgi:hypothetical protein